MFIVVGLLIFLSAVVVGAVGVVSNAGAEHLLADDFSVFTYHVTGSTGTVLLYGILIGAVGFAGLSLVLAGAARAAGRGRAARAELKRTQEGADLVNRDRDRLLERQHEASDARDTTKRASSRGRWWRRRDPNVENLSDADRSVAQPPAT